MMNEVPARGNLKKYSLPRILSYLHKQHKTGILTIAVDNTRKKIYMKDGNAVFASSNLDEDRLGDMLLRTGKITSEQYDKSVEMLKKTGKQQGQILVELGYLKPKELFYEVKNQTEEIILSLFQLQDGMFIFKDSSLPGEAITLTLGIESLIRKGIKRKEIKKKEEERFFIKKVNELYEKIADLSFYDILGINMKASPLKIKKAYFKVVKDYHPDKCLDLSNSSITDKVTTLFTLINKAYDTLSNETKKAEYDAILLKKKHAKNEDRDIIQAEEQFKRGIEELKTGNFWGAADCLRWATKINPQKSKYWAHLSLALRNIPRRIKEAEENMLKAIELEPYNANYYVSLGIIYLQSGMKKRAAQQFGTALKWDPTNKKAQTELEKLKKKHRWAPTFLKSE